MNDCFIMHNLKEKLIDIWDTISYRLVDAYKSTRYWIYCNLNKYHFNTIKTAYLGYPWSDVSIYELEAAKIDEYLNWFEDDSKTTSSTKIEEKIRYLKLAKKLLHYICTDSAELWHMEGEPECVKIKSDPDYWEFRTGTLKYVYDGPKLNLKNATRFVPTWKDSDKIITGHLDWLYTEKCKYLYHKIRFEKGGLWWD